jgi:hypothetical protein
VRNGVVSVPGNSSKQLSYGQLIGGKRFNVRIQAEGRGNDLKLAQDVKRKIRKIIVPSAPREALRSSTEAHR